MKKTPIMILLVASLALVLFAAPAYAAPEKPVIVAHLKGALEADVQLKAIIGNITWIDWVVVTGELTSSDLSEATMLIMVKADSTLEYTAAELTAVKSWFDRGGKTLWVAADSDYGDDRLRQPTANEVLEKVGSALRIEACSAEDPVSNAGRSYRVLGVSENCDEEVEFLVAGVERGLFHGPAIITAYSGGRYYKIEESKPEGVYVVMTTSDTGVVVNNNPPDPEVHEVGDEGNFPLMAIELMKEKKNVVIATGDAPYDQYAGLYKPELRRYQRYAVDYPQQGAKLFENIITYAVHYSENIMDLENQVAAEKAQVDTLEGQVSSLRGEVADLKVLVASLEGQVSSLEGDKTTLEGEVATLEGEVADLKGSVGSWRMISAATFVVGLIVGVAVVYAMKR